MTKYEVIITRNITESTSVIVFAPDRNKAEDAALKNLWHHLESAEWEVDDDSCDGEVYVTNVEEAE